MLNTLKSVSYDDPEYHYFSPEDLAAMRHAYYTASVQRPKAVQTHDSPDSRKSDSRGLQFHFPASAIADAAWLTVSDLA